MNGRAWTQQEDEILRELWALGAHDLVISTRLRRNKSSCRTRAHHLGLGFRAARIGKQPVRFTPEGKRVLHFVHFRLADPNDPTERV